MSDTAEASVIEHNPFQPPASTNEDGSRNWTEEERIRRAHLSHEANVKSIGGVFLLGAILCAVCGFVTYAVGPNTSPSGLAEQRRWIALFLVIGLFLIVAATAVSQLRPWSRVPAIILSAAFVLAIPVGPFLGPYFLYLLGCEKGRTVFSAEYREIISQTPHIKYRTPLSGWIILGLLVLGLIGLSVFTSGR